MTFILLLAKRVCFTVIVSLWGAYVFAQPTESEQVAHYLSLATLNTNSAANNETKQGLFKQNAYYVAAAQFALEACMAGISKQCEQLSYALNKGLGVKPNQVLANKWQGDLTAPSHIKHQLYQQTLAWFNSARVQRISLTKIKQGQCHKVEWQRTFIEKEPVFVCRRTTKQLASLSLPAMPKELISPSELAKQLADSDRANELIAMAPLLEQKTGRSLKPEWFVVSGAEPRFGCLITTSFKQNIAFKNPCHGDEWDSIGLPLVTKVNKEQSQKTQPLNIPPYSLNGDELVLGKLPNGNTIHYKNLKPEPLITQKMSPAEQLAMAARWQQLPLLKSLLKVNSYESMKASPKRPEILIQAISTQYLPLIQLLLENGFQLDEQTKYGGSANEVVKILKNPAINDLLKRNQTGR